MTSWMLEDAWVFPRGGGGFLNTMQFPRFSNFSRSGVAMVCHWAVQREQNKDQRHSTPFKESRTRTKHIVAPSTEHAEKNSATLVPWPLHHYLSNSGGGLHKRTGPSRPPSPL